MFITDVIRFVFKENKSLRGNDDDSPFPLLIET